MTCTERLWSSALKKWYRTWASLSFWHVEKSNVDRFCSNEPQSAKQTNAMAVKPKKLSKNYTWLNQFFFLWNDILLCIPFIFICLWSLLLSICDHSTEFIINVLKNPQQQESLNVDSDACNVNFFFPLFCVPVAFFPLSQMKAHSNAWTAKNVQAFSIIIVTRMLPPF